MIIVTICDEKYFFSEGQYLLKSLYIHNTKLMIVLVIVNAGKKTIDFIKNKHKNVLIEEKRINNEYYSFKDLMCCYRMLVLDELMQKYDDSILYLDSDVVIRGNLDKLANIIDSYDLSVLFRPQVSVLGALGTYYAGRFNSGVIGLRKCNVIKEFLTKYHLCLTNLIINKSPLSNTFKNIYTAVDQEYLYILYLEYKEKINFYSLDSIYNDSKLSLHSIIWHGKGTNKELLIYLLEKMYLNKIIPMFVKTILQKLLIIISS